YGIKIYPIYFDLTDSNKMKSEIQKVYKTAGNIDVLINNAGMAHGGLFQMTPVQQIREVFDVNFFSMIELSQYVSRLMIRKNKGCIINMASVAGIDLKVGNCAYGTSKAAVIALTKTMSYELSPLGIRVNAIAPGLAETDMALKMERKAGEEMIQETALKRLAKKEEIAELALFLASEQASFITGQVIRIDGGM
ncbi:MAG: SDR family NAD(P)-dependent oxidoreductase, partial [Muribaculaceae bacterium]